MGGNTSKQNKYEIDKPCEITGLMPDEIAILNNMWKTIEADIHPNSLGLYARFFEKYPQYKNLFAMVHGLHKDSLAVEAHCRSAARTKLLAIGKLLKALPEGPKIINNYFEYLGLVHRNLELQEKDFMNFRDALMEHLTIEYKKEMTPFVENAFQIFLTAMVQNIYKRIEEIQIQKPAFASKADNGQGKKEKKNGIPKDTKEAVQNQVPPPEKEQHDYLQHRQKFWQDQKLLDLKKDTDETEPDLRYTRRKSVVMFENDTLIPDSRPDRPSIPLSSISRESKESRTSSLFGSRSSKSSKSMHRDSIISSESRTSMKTGASIRRDVEAEAYFRARQNALHVQLFQNEQQKEGFCPSCIRKIMR